jgi:hypothetical protein
MSDYADLFTSFYNQFILRDLLSIILPGFILIIAALYSNFETKIIIDFFADNLSFLIVFVILGISYVLGILLLLLADRTRICSTFYTATPTEQREQSIRFYRTLSLVYKDEERIFANMRERYIIFMQTCGNMTWTSIISLFIVLFSYILRKHLSQEINDFWHNQIFLIIFFAIIAIFFCIGHYHFKDYLKDWDKIIIDRKTQ